jgi:alpha-glucosidase
VAEAWVTPAARLSRYVRADEMQQAFNFSFLSAGWSASALRATITESLASNDAVGATTTWVLSNHDVVRHRSRFGLPDPSGLVDGLGPADVQPDLALGLDRARAATLAMLSLPGSAYLFQGEELGLYDSVEIPAEDRQDPKFHRTGGRSVGRDGARVPLPWTSDAPGIGFSPTGRGWLPQPESFRDLAVDRQEQDPASTLHFYREALAARRDLSPGGGLRWNVSSPGVLDFSRGRTRVLLNAGDLPTPLPGGAVIAMASSTSAVVDGALQPNHAVWLTDPER